MAQPTVGPQEHYAALGKLAVAASQLEETMIVFNVALHEDQQTGTEEVDTKYRDETWARNTKSLRKKIKQRFTARHQKQLLKFLTESDRLRALRNKNVHSLWQIMVDADAGTYSHVLRIRKPTRGPDKKLDIAQPDPAEIEQLAAEIATCARDFGNKFRDYWDIDDNVRTWREKAPKLRYGPPIQTLKDFGKLWLLSFATLYATALVFCLGFATAKESSLWTATRMAGYLLLQTWGGMAAFVACAALGLIVAAIPLITRRSPICR